jgi:hypothetical protein
LTFSDDPILQDNLSNKPGRMKGEKRMKINAGMESVYASVKNEMTQDGRNNAVIAYAERWADMMEQQIGNGASVSEAAAKTWYEANQENISWFMYGNAVRVLVNFWDHGEELQQWQQQSNRPQQVQREEPQVYQAFDAQTMS